MSTEVLFALSCSYTKLFYKYAISISALTSEWFCTLVLKLYGFLCMTMRQSTFFSFFMFIGSVFIGLKNNVFEHSTPFRHACEPHNILQSLSLSKSILFVYSDGGPDHRLTYFSVKLSLICLFLKQDLDYLCAGRTAPHHSWRNPVERIMSILNLGLQCVGLARALMPDELLQNATHYLSYESISLGKN